MQGSPLIHDRADATLHKHTSVIRSSITRQSPTKPIGGGLPCHRSQTYRDGSHPRHRDSTRPVCSDHQFNKQRTRTCSPRPSECRFSRSHSESLSLLVLRRPKTQAGTHLRLCIPCVRPTSSAPHTNSNPQSETWAYDTCEYHLDTGDDKAEGKTSACHPLCPPRQIARGR